MVRKLTNSQIVESWDDLKPALALSSATTPIDFEGQLLELLERLLSGEAQLWVGVVDSKIVCLCTTFIGRYILNNKKEFVVAGFYGYSTIPEGIWLEFRETLITYAKDMGCVQITAYTKNSKILQVAAQSGADIETRFIRWSI